MAFFQKAKSSAGNWAARSPDGCSNKYIRDTCQIGLPFYGGRGGVTMSALTPEFPFYEHYLQLQGKVKEEEEW